MLKHISLARKLGRRATIAALLLLLITVAAPARADVTACLDAHAEGQRASKAGQWKLASELFAACASNDACPEPVRAECVDFYAAAQKSVPTVIFSATDARGRDVAAVRVYSGEALVSETLDGRALVLDPGTHRFRFVFGSGEVVEKDVLIREGEKNRIVNARAAAAAPALPPAGSTPEPENPERASLPTSFWIASGVGAVALASFGVFALAGRGEQSTIDACSPNCDTSRRANYDAMRRNYLIADVSLGIAVVSAGVATWSFLSSRKDPTAARGSRRERQSAGVSVAPFVSGSGAGVAFDARGF